MEKENDENREEISAHRQAILIFSVDHHLPVSDEDAHFMAHWLQFEEVFNETCCRHRNPRIECEMAQSAGALSFGFHCISLIEHFDMFDISPRLRSIEICHKAFTSGGTLFGHCFARAVYFI